VHAVGSASFFLSSALGTYGLGALSMYHFTDVISVLSDTGFLALDNLDRWLGTQSKMVRISATVSRFHL
jgi:hypothetical protein